MPSGVNPKSIIRRTAIGTTSVVIAATVSDRTGREEVFISDEFGKTVKKISDAECDKSGLVWSPDAKTLLWSGSDHKLRMVDVDSGKTDIVAQSDAGNIAAAVVWPFSDSSLP